MQNACRKFQQAKQQIGIGLIPLSVVAVNSVESEPESIVGFARVLVRIRADITIPWSVHDAITIPGPTAPTTTTIPQCLGITTFDGKYSGTAIATVNQNDNVISLLSSTLNTSNTGLDSDMTGTSVVWKIYGYVIDVACVATVTASNSV